MDTRPHRTQIALSYKVTNLINGNFYIGITSKHELVRWRNHVSCALRGKYQGRFHRAIRKYGEEAFRVSVLKRYDTYNEATTDEKRLIKILKPAYNSTKGGDGGCGYVWSSASRKIISEQKMGHSYNVGIKRSEKTKRALSIIGKKPENLERWSTFSSLGPKAMQRAVICLDDNMIYPSASEAARVYGMSKSIIIEVCNKYPRRKTAGNLVFRYANDPHDGKAEADAVRTERDFNRRKSGLASRKKEKTE